MNQSKWIIILICMTVIAAVLTGIFIRSSMHDYYHEAIKTNPGNYVVRCIPSMPNEDINYPSINDLEADANVIVCVSFSGNRIIQFNCMLSEVTVFKVIKGELNESNIWVYEPGYFHYISQSGLSVAEIRDSYTPMIQGPQYLLFLEPIEMPRPYRLNQGQYKLVNNTFGKIGLSDVFTADLFTLESLKTKYNEISNMQIVTDSLDILEQFQENIEDAYNKYHLEAS